MDEEQRKALLRWNIANRNRRLAAISGAISLPSYARYQYRRLKHRLMRLDPARREALAVLWRQLGQEAVEVLFGHPLLTLDQKALAEITGAPFWRNVLLPLDRATGVPPLFDAEFYVRQQPTIEPRSSPLAHYVLVGAGEGRNPHRLFSTAWYLAQNPDVASSGQNPLLHFANHGGPEGRSPHPEIRATWYHATYDSVRQDGRAAYPKAQEISRRHYTIHDLGSGGPREPATKCPIICISHVLPSRPRAGNEYRISRILDRLEARGHELVVVVAPEEAGEPDTAEREAFFEKYANAIVCCRDGNIFVSSCSLRLSLASVHGRPIGDIVRRDLRGKAEQPLTALERSFCHEALIGVLATIAKQVPNAIYYINYAFMTRFLPYLPEPPVSFIDTHDVLSDKAHKVATFGIVDNAAVSVAEEQRMLQRGSAVLAIHADDALKLAALAGNKPVLTAGVDFIVPDVGAPPDQPTILVIAHNNALNLKGLQDFLRFAWPLIKVAIPNVRFVVVGSVGQAVRYPDPQVRFVGIVDDLGPYYQHTRVVINPSVAGTGLKIKTVESVAYYRPIVSFPNGVDGIPKPLLDMCHVATNWYEFAQQVIDLLAADSSSVLPPHGRDEIRRQLEPGTVYKELDAWLAELDQAIAS